MTQQQQGAQSSGGGSGSGGGGGGGGGSGSGGGGHPSAAAVPSVAPDELQLGRRLGGGGFGDVRQATWRSHEVAVKQIRGADLERVSEAARCPPSLRRRRPTQPNAVRVGEDRASLVRLQEMSMFRNEVGIMAPLRHPNVVQLLATCEATDQVSLVLQYCSGGSLRKALSTKGVPETAQAMRWAADAARCPAPPPPLLSGDAAAAAAAPAAAAASAADSHNSCGRSLTPAAAGRGRLSSGCTAGEWHGIPARPPRAAPRPEVRQPAAGDGALL